MGWVSFGVFEEKIKPTTIILDCQTKTKNKKQHDEKRNSSTKNMAACWLNEIIGRTFCMDDIEGQSEEVVGQKVGT